ncbi:MAG TPA: hypothetical protein VF802_01385 [Candidatus Limnocylindrales bacterium]
MPLLVVAFLAVHALIHASFMQSRPPATAGGPAWPFDLAHSWMLTPIGLDGSATRAIGVVLLAIVLVGYAAAALAVLGPVPGSVFVPAIVTASIASVVMLAVFFSPWFVLGFVIDAALIWAVLAAGWRPGEVGL